MDCADLAPSTKLAPGGESLIVSNPPWGMRLDGPESEEAGRGTRTKLALEPSWPCTFHSRSPSLTLTLALALTPARALALARARALPRALALALALTSSRRGEVSAHSCDASAEAPR